MKQKEYRELCKADIEELSTDLATIQENTSSHVALLLPKLDELKKFLCFESASQGDGG
jgi:hypothetical protein